MTERTDYLETYTGRKVFPTSYSHGDVCMIDVAHHLSMKCRYGGATEPFYSVAEHSLVLAQYFLHHNPGFYEGALNMLLHDAGEYLLPDVQRPVKHLAPALTECERNVGRIVREMAGLEGPEPPYVKAFDKRITQDERAHFMSDSGNAWLLEDGQEPLDVQLVGDIPRIAEERFKAYYAWLMYRWTGRIVYTNRSLTLDDLPSILASAHSDFAGRDALDADWIEVDAIGGVGLFWKRDESGMYVRDRKAPRPIAKTVWIRGLYDIAHEGPG